MVRVADINDFVNAGTGFIDKGRQAAEQTGNDTSAVGFANQFVDIGRILIAIGVVTLLIVSAIMAIRWLTATPDKQAKLKTQLIGLVISAVVIFGAVGIWNLLWSILSNLESTM